MKVTVKTTGSTTFKNLAPGDVFECGGSIFLRITGNSPANCVLLSTGRCVIMSRSAIVEHKPDAELIVN